MWQVTTDAIVLRTYNLAEADRIVVCLTRSAGLVRGVAKGARRMKSRFGAALEPFTLIKITFNEKENRDLVSISNVEILKSSFALGSDFQTSEVLAYIAELVGEFAPPHEPDDRLFRMLAACVETLQSKSDAQRAVTRYFEIWLLRLAGLFPDLSSCHECSTVLTSSDVSFVDMELRVRCGKCRPASASLMSLAVLSTIRASQKLSPARFADSYDLSEQSDVELSDLTHRLISRAIERRPRTVFASAR